MKYKRRKAECCVPNCALPSFCYGRCHAHFFDLKSNHISEFLRLKAMSHAARKIEIAKTTVPREPQPWEYEPSPEKISELIAQFGGNGDAK
jgi:hypothetical protein